MTLCFPAHMVSILASLAGLRVTPASPYVVFHANRLLLFSKFDLAVVWYANLFPFDLPLPFPLEFLFSKSLVMGFVGAPAALDWGFCVEAPVVGEGIGMM